MMNWSDIRKAFPVTTNSTYLNTAAAGPLARVTTQAATGYYQEMMEGGDVHWEEWLARREVVRAKVAAFINAEPEEIGFTTNTSTGMNVIIDALENHGEVISSDLEFPVSTIPWMHRRIPVHLVKSVAGAVHPSDLHRAMNVRSGVISISYVQFSNGFRMNLDELGNIKGGHALVVNASQAAGVFELDVKRMKIDALCATGHKWMRSGYGSGFVYISKALLGNCRPRAIGWLSVQDPYAMKNDEVHLRQDLAARAELGCPNFAGIFGLGAALELMEQVGMRNIAERALEINRLLTDRLQSEGWEVLSPLRDEHDRSAETLVKSDNPSAMVRKLFEKRVIVTEKPQGIRVATDFFNNKDDIEQLVETMNEAGKLRR
jgi:cysteine desulfurase/selenocysteine lyase